mmetsp:Transcript_3437/g.5267  ORF Transcript_3437/g.5267 Transcript_3437/m.5267 type:complete len:506 (-) Transcript_3437:862-2379(-)
MKQQQKQQQRRRRRRRSSNLSTIWLIVATNHAVLNTSSAFQIPTPLNRVLSMSSSSSFVVSSTTQQQQEQEEPLVDDNNNGSSSSSSSTTTNMKFDLNTALFCGGLAFDAYVEPPQNSSRWEKGSQGMNVAFLSSSFTKNVYRGMLEVTPLQISGLPEEDDAAESMLSGSGVDACLLVAAVEGQWKEDLELLQKDYHEGILDLTGAAHVGRSRTAWSNVNEQQSQRELAKTGQAKPYHVKKSWGKDAKAVWPEGEEPFYLYIQDPKTVQLLFTIFDDDVIGDGSALGSTYIPLTKVLPQVAAAQSAQVEDALIDQLKQDVLKKLQSGQIDAANLDQEIQKSLQQRVPVWEGELKVTSKPRIKNKNNQITMGAAAGAMVAGPMGAAAGALLANLYEGQLKGRISVRLRYLPIPNSSSSISSTTQQQQQQRKVYQVLGGMPGIDWGTLYDRYLQKENQKKQQEEEDANSSSSNTEAMADATTAEAGDAENDTTGGAATTTTTTTTSE